MSLTVDGATRLHIIVGDPIAQVKSPAGMTAEFAARGANAVMVPVHVSSADLMAVLEAASRMGNLDSIVVTIPHKFACYAFCTSTTERAAFLGAVNMMRRAPGGWHGDMTDGQGMTDAIRAKGGRFDGARVLLAGAGGAGSAIALAVVEAGARELAIHDTDAKRRDSLIARLKARNAKVVSGSDDPSGFDIVINASPAGMKPDDAYPVDVTKLTSNMFAACVITSPAVSPFITAARNAGCRTCVGGDMFAAQVDFIVDFLLSGSR
ncbi:MAG: shikimate dehydrogenase [Pseudolabrys sp.]|nr:shikimate dehydrogenase [Pseudolabrys sp.]